MLDFVVRVSADQVSLFEGVLGASPFNELDAVLRGCLQAYRGFRELISCSSCSACPSCTLPSGAD